MYVGPEGFSLLKWRTNRTKKVPVNTKRPNFPQMKKPLPPLSSSVQNLQRNEQEQPAAVQPPEPVPAQPPVPVQPQITIEPTQEQMNSAELEEIPIIQAPTYISIGNKEHGFVEFDLMSHREKGSEVRYMNIQVRGFSLDDKGSPGNTYMAITSKDDFEKVKSFFSTLKWED